MKAITPEECLMMVLYHNFDSIPSHHPTLAYAKVAYVTQGLHLGYTVCVISYATGKAKLTVLLQ